MSNQVGQSAAVCQPNRQPRDPIAHLSKHPCEQEQLKKLPKEQKSTNPQLLEAQLKELCHMSKAWDLTAKLNIPQLSDPEFDPVADPIQLPLLPFQKSYLKSHQQCKDSNACLQSLAKRTLKARAAAFRARKSRKFRNPWIIVAAKGPWFQALVLADVMQNEDHSRDPSVEVAALAALNIPPPPSLMDRQGPPVVKREAPVVKVIRKEYRAMTDQERLAFQNAVVALKNKVVNSSYNAFDLHASLHSAAYSPQAHFGCSFIPFHRIYLLMLEKQLQEVSGDNTVAIPYWDSTLDSQLPSPCDSVYLIVDNMNLIVDSIKYLILLTY
uniref:Tyrosinase copper-binding domain-containing protein n=1 Tax=Romanomermis culicivorax TaxID=13658 RepID=A0A915I8I8_ROMCU